MNGTLPPNPWRYAGGALDATGLYHFGARYYDPAIGRWTQQDSIVSLGDPSNANRYAYAGDDPVNFVDPSGLGFCALFIRNSKGCLGGSINDNSNNFTRAAYIAACGLEYVGATAATVASGGTGAAPAFVGATAACEFQDS